MDPVSAVGVAAAAVQFLDASIKAYNAFQEIRHGSEPATKHNQQLEDNIRSAQSLRASLVSTHNPQRANEPLSKLTQQCTSKADELLTLFEYVRGSGKNISSLRAMGRALRKRKDIEELHLSLKESQDTLNHMIFQELLPSIDLLQVQQSKEFANIGSIGQKLIKEQIEQRRVQEVHNATVTHKLDNIQQDMRLHVDEADRQKRHKKLLESLWFPQIDQRRNEIKEPAPSTLEWFFGSEPDTNSESDENSIHQPSWPNFRQWLRKDTTTYWISGKAGSGKSTLMAHVIDDERTWEDLKIWSSGQRLEVLSFFFWRAGSELQNSVLGLLRSLLYQLCLLEPIIVDTILSKSSSPGAMMPTWTERSLLSLVIETIQFCEKIRLCIFIDGLDEFTGPYDHLVDQIDKLGGYGNLKLCVSSRPELELVKRFQGLKCLRLQDLNRGDITKFVRNSLKKTQLRQHLRKILVGEVVKRANGVFLWAALVTQSLVKGSKAGDDEKLIRERLDILPSDMNQLFERMLSDVDPVHRKSLAFYVHVMKLNEKPRSEVPFPVFVMAQMDRPANSYEEFANECKITETRITTRSAGLLEVGNDYVHVTTHKTNWGWASLKYVSDHPNFELTPKTRDRRRCPKGEPFPAMLEFEGRRIKWIHRSAFEFVSTLNNSPLIDVEWSDEELFHRIGEAWIKYTVDVPSYTNDVWFSELADRLRSIVSFIDMWHDNYPTVATALLDILYSTCTKIEDKYELISDRNLSYSAYSAYSESTIGGFFFWDTCANLGCLYPYMLCRVDSILNQGADGFLVAHILAITFTHYGYRASPSLSQFTNSMADILLRTIINNGLEIGGLTGVAKCTCVVEEHGVEYIDGFNCVTWKEPITAERMLTIGALLHILNDRSLVSSWQGNLQVPASLFTLLDTMDLYVSKYIHLNRMRIQLSATALLAISKSIAERGGNQDKLIAHISAFEGDRPIQLLCLPSYKRERKATFIDSGWANYVDYPLPGRATVLEASDFIRIQCSAATSDQILSLLTYNTPTEGSAVEFSISSDHQKLRGVTDMILKDIKSAKQGLDGGQQLIAAACVKAGLLDLDIAQANISSPTFTDYFGTSSSGDSDKSN